MLHKNISNNVYVMYDTLGVKHVIKPQETAEDSILPEVITMSTFVPYGAKRTPKLHKESQDGN